MRLANDTDRGQVTGTASDNLKGLFDMLPVLRTGEAIIVGEAVSLPVRTLIDPPQKDRRPDSVDPRVVVPGDANKDGFSLKTSRVDIGTPAYDHLTILVCHAPSFLR